MKKLWIGISIVVIVTLTFFLCMNRYTTPDKIFEGNVEAYHYYEGGLNYIVVYNPEVLQKDEKYRSEKYKVFISENTDFTSPVSGFKSEDFTEGKYGKVYLTGTGHYSERECKYYADMITLDSAISEVTMKLSDGSKVAVWNRINSTEYRLENGDLLLITHVYEPDFITEKYYGIHELTDKAVNEIKKFFGEKGYQFNLQDALEEAYINYSSSGEKKATSMIQVTKAVESTENTLTYETEIIITGLKDYSKKYIYTFNNTDGKFLESSS